MSKISLERLDYRINKIKKDFVQHLWISHDIPIEVSKKMLNKLSYNSLFQMMLQHKNFIESVFDKRRKI